MDALMSLVFTRPDFVLCFRNVYHYLFDFLVPCFTYGCRHCLSTCKVMHGMQRGKARKRGTFGPQGHLVEEGIGRRNRLNRKSKGRWENSSWPLCICVSVGNRILFKPYIFQREEKEKKKGKKLFAKPCSILFFWNLPDL